jgi:NADH:ubiquinone oxidoreductase subunit F (NADH-binding)
VTPFPLTTAVHPAIRPRLLLPDREPGREDREDSAAYHARGGYRPGLTGRALIDAVARSGLRGRGGAAFPTARKLASVAGAPGEHVLIANGEEGEPASAKDRWLLRHRPHLVLDGALRAAQAAGAGTVYVYVSDPVAAASVRAAIDELPDSALELTVELTVVEVDPGYVAGEETAAVRAIDGGPAKPTDKPPRPFEAGVRGLPTLVCNVETLAVLPAVAGGAGCGSFLLTLGGDCPRPGLYEVPYGIALGEAVDLMGGQSMPPRGYLMGGYFAGLLNARGHRLPLDPDRLAEAGSGLGCGAVAVLGPGDCPIWRTAQVLAYFDLNNAGQCGSCYNGTAAMSGVVSALAHGAARSADLDRLGGWTRSLPGRGACGTLDGAANAARTLLREFPETVSEHLAGRCRRCAELAELEDLSGADPNRPAAPFAVDLRVAEDQLT